MSGGLRRLAAAVTASVGIAVLLALLGGCGGGGGGASGGNDAGTMAPAPSPAGSMADAEAAAARTPVVPPTPGTWPAARPGQPVSAAGCRTLGIDGRPRVTGEANPQVPPLARPSKGTAIVEPAFGTCLVRVTDHAAEPPAGFARNDYSRRQAFNADGSLQLVYALDGAWHLYDGATQAWLRRLDGPAGDAEPQWHPDDPSRLAYLPTNGIGMQVLELDVRTQVTTVVASLGPRLRARWPQAAAAWTRSEGSPSADGGTWCLLVEDAAFRPLGVVAWDRTRDAIVGWLDLAGQGRPDHLSASPSGAWCVVSWDDRVVAWDRGFGTARALGVRGEHSDIAIDAAGDDVYVSVDYESPGGALFMLRLRDGRRTDLFDTYVGGTATALHVSGKAFRKPGWALVSTYGAYVGATGEPATRWPHAKLMAVQLAASPRIVQLAHARTADRGYWTEPQASVNRDFTKVAFTTNWGTASETDVDAWLVELPPGALD